MFSSSIMQALLFPVAVLYLALHLGPMLRIVYEPSIRGGTRWQFFASEVALSSAQLLFSPAVFNSQFAKFAVVAHLGMHVVFTSIDFFAHDFLLGSALTPRGRSFAMWFAKEAGLVLDTAAHAVVVLVVAAALPAPAIAGSVALAATAYLIVTRSYVHRHGAVVQTEV